MTGKFPRWVEDIMTRQVEVLHQDESLELAASAMKAFCFRHIPVVEGKRLVGLVTERDILRASISSLDEDYELRDDKLKRYRFVGEIMTLVVHTVRPETPLLEAAKLLREKKLGCLPVVRDDGTLVGIVTQSDFLRLAIDFLGAEERRSFAAARTTSAG